MVRHSNFARISPRAAIADEKLVRPNWVVGQPRAADKLWLDKNENLDPILSAFIHEAITLLPPEAATVCPDVGPLYAKLGKVLSLPPTQLMMTSGSDAAIASVFQAFVSPGDTVMRTNPTFAMYGVYAQIFGADEVLIDYQPSDAGPVLDVDAAISAIERHGPKLVCLPNPDSPTGTVLPAEWLNSIAAACGRLGAVMLIDEAYYPFYEETSLPLLDDHSNVVVVRSTSKSWGLAGIRVGYCVAGAELVTLLHKVKPMYEIGAFAAALFLRLLDHTDEMNTSVQRLLAGKAAFARAMRDMAFKTLPTQGNFQHVAFGARSDAVHAALADLVLYRRDFTEPCLAGFSRFSATTTDGFKPVIDRIAEVA